MFVGVAVWDLHLAGCASLKEKRRVLVGGEPRVRIIDSSITFY
ncbi:hypothetical protein BH20GEM2_BH20GEM2_17390 [soil metagenome]